MVGKSGAPTRICLNQGPLNTRPRRQPIHHREALRGFGGDGEGKGGVLGVWEEKWEEREVSVLVKGWWLW